jgi:hypothetical protein
MGAFPIRSAYRAYAPGIFPWFFSVFSQGFHGLFRNAEPTGFFNMRRSAWRCRPVTCDTVMIKKCCFKTTAFG